MTEQAPQIDEISRFEQLKTALMAAARPVGVVVTGLTLTACLQAEGNNPLTWGVEEPQGTVTDELDEEGWPLCNENLNIGESEAKLIWKCVLRVDDRPRNDNGTIIAPEGFTVLGEFADSLAEAQNNEDIEEPTAQEQTQSNDQLSFENNDPNNPINLWKAAKARENEQPQESTAEVSKPGTVSVQFVFPGVTEGEPVLEVDIENCPTTVIPYAESDTIWGKTLELVQAGTEERFSETEGINYQTLSHRLTNRIAAQIKAGWNGEQLSPAGPGFDVNCLTDGSGVRFSTGNE